MANRWLFAGVDLGMIRQIGAPTTSTTAGTFNSTYADHSVTSTSVGVGGFCDFTTSAGASDSVTSGETLNTLHYFYHQNNTTTAGFIFRFVDGSDQPWLAFRSTTSSGVYGFYYNSGTGASPTWTLIGSTFSLASATLFAININLTIGSPHSAEIFVDGVSKASGTFTQSSLTAIDAVALTTSANSDRFSEVAATVGISLVGGHVFYGKPSGAGSNSGWTGAYTTIDDVGVDDTDLISSGTAGQRSTFAYANLPTLAAGYTIGDSFMWTRAKNDGTAPTNVKPVRRDSGGTDNVGSSFSGMGVGFADFLTRYSVSAAEYDASEFGVESAT